MYTFCEMLFQLLAVQLWTTALVIVLDIQMFLDIVVQALLFDSR